MVLAVAYPWASASSYLSSQSLADSSRSRTGGPLSWSCKRDFYAKENFTSVVQKRIRELTTLGTGLVLLKISLSGLARTGTNKRES